MTTNSKALSWWEKLTDRTAKNSGRVERYPTHTLAVLPDGGIMFVRKASLTAAKELLAAERAALRKLAARRLIYEALDDVEARDNYL